MNELTNKPRILVVDDDEKSRLAVSAVLDDLDIEVVENREYGCHQLSKEDNRFKGIHRYG